ncbi:uncharacterized protein LACBIDRAFT_318320 [Laccaria bicolor S238N-H82]|uniref:Predicted protein n=1 Tax=Laccaria bicolor (strain S238N-H82 / ATCC MYA-4686) TaxID=486041 RepID=B0D6G8_LACBS|nr:uncharacterized protein LACBIDRAFT_318320 [Laccaria bicolor S238N-H82]EDR09951.1 predicted protein [Laccaria bicolor S238N-H82]|eukprot:XP_001879336.1 predicted protein [Laccaria bicolor S238N-H82]
MPILQSIRVGLRSGTIVELFDSEPEPVLHLLAAINSAILVEVLLYGIHCILFCVCAYIFLSRRLVKPFIIGSAIIMFALSTADVAISLGLLVGGLRMPFEDETHLLTCRYPKNPIFVANNLIADMLLVNAILFLLNGRPEQPSVSPMLRRVGPPDLYRCCCRSVSTSRFHLGMGGGRSAIIFYSRHLFIDISLDGVLHQHHSNRCYRNPHKLSQLVVFSGFPESQGLSCDRDIFDVTTLLSLFCKPLAAHFLPVNRTGLSNRVESAVVYSTCIFIYLVFSKYSSSLYKLIFASIVMRIVAIMPTLMIVRVGLGKGLDDEGRDDVDARERQAQPTSVVFDSIVSVQSSIHEADTGKSPSRDPDTFLLEETSGNVDVFPMVAVQSMSRL